MSSASKGRPVVFECPECGRVFLESGGMRRHYSQKHGSILPKSEVDSSVLNMTTEIVP